MPNQAHAKAFRVALTLVGTCLIGASAASQQVASEHPTGVVDCRAGCQGNPGGCQESVKKEAYITAHAGYRLLPDTLRIIGQWNASDSPGLSREPRWETIRYPVGSDRPYSITVRPILSSCLGVSPHTQGVTFYQFQVLEQL